MGRHVPALPWLGLAGVACLVLGATAAPTCGAEASPEREADEACALQTHGRRLQTREADEETFDLDGGALATTLSTTTTQPPGRNVLFTDGNMILELAPQAAVMSAAATAATGLCAQEAALEKAIANTYGQPTPEAVRVNITRCVEISGTAARIAYTMLMSTDLANKNQVTPESIQSSGDKLQVNMNALLPSGLQLSTVTPNEPSETLVPTTTTTTTTTTEKPCPFSGRRRSDWGCRRRRSGHGGGWGWD